MKKTLLSNAGTIALGLSLACGAFASLSLSTAQEGAKKQEGPAKQEGAAEKAEDGHDGEHGELHESMEVLGKGMKGLRKLLKKPEEKAAALELVVSMQHAAVEGFLNPPEAAEGMEAADALAFQVDFKKRMLSVAGTLCDLEVALDKGDGDKAKELYRDLGKSKKDGHDIYIGD